jgi:adenine deaminase
MRTSHRELLDAARGRRVADLVVEGGALVNVHTAEIYPADVAIVGDAIAAVGDVDDLVGPETERLDATARHVIPGLIDAHLHTYETHLSVPHVSTALLLRGVTSIATDFYGEAVVGGVEAVRSSLAAAELAPLNVLWTLPMPAYYQDRPFAHTGTLDDATVLEMLDWEECIGVNECFASFVVAGDELLLDVIERARHQGKALCGHASEVRGQPLRAWVAYGGDLDDHECTAPDEVVEKARLGVRIVLREGSGASDVRNCLPAITRRGVDSRRFSFCSDLLSPVDLAREGDIDRCIRYAVKGGIDPVEAVRMGTLNAAETLGVDRFIGVLAPGKRADLCLVDNLEGFEVTDVVAGGRLVVSGGEYVGSQPRLEYPASARGTVRLAVQPTPQDFWVRAEGARARVRTIEARDGTIVTGEGRALLRVRDGNVLAAPDQDVLKIASLERHGGSGKMGLGFVRGFGLRRGALASTYNPHCQHLLVVGAEDVDMAAAAAAVREMGGGFAVVEGSRVLARVPLPLYGLLSEAPAPELVSQIEEAIEQARELGCRLSAPFHTLAFVGLPVVIGKLKICSEGLVDVWNQTTVPPVLEPEPATAGVDNRKGSEM